MPGVIKPTESLRISQFHLGGAMIENPRGCAILRLVSGNEVGTSRPT